MRDILICRSEEDSLSSEEEVCFHKNWATADLHTIDVSSAHFKSLPADVRHDILSELKETRKQSSWGRLHEMPKVKNLTVYLGKLIC
jgi:DNA excision repair protein ERCC-5